jgi:acetylornithine deacetylase
MHKAVRIARDLIAIPSVNPMGTGASGEIYSERGVASYVQNFCRQLGLDTDIAGKNVDHPNVLASAQLGLPETVLLEAHMDTVSHENMTIDPFDPVIKDDLLYGRGSCDTKASLASYLSAVSTILKSGRRLKRNFVIAGVHDEEYSFGGSRELVERGIRATFAIAGEPTSLNIIYAHKGVCRFHIHAKGTAAHAALPQSAIARSIEWQMY